jgi:uncharacterized protein YbbC (DUF1343 family)
MKKYVIIFFLMIIFTACESARISKEETNLGKSPVTQRVDGILKETLDVVVGAAKTSDYLPFLQGKRVAMVVNQTSTIGSVHLVDTLQNLGVNVKKVFAPEHGFRGDHSAGAVIKNGLDVKTGLPVVSLYGANKKPTADMLKDIDVVVFDIQDVGVRFYTYISTMHYVMEACAELGKKVLILDRPNPNGFYVDGPVLEKEFTSFIGMHPIPLVHGLTVGELAIMINGESWLKGGAACELKIVTCDNYDHATLYQLPIKPSPNLPNMNSVYFYPYLGLFEGTNVSIGRGTSTPFQIVGRPGVKGDIEFTPIPIPGVADDPKHENKLCGGFEVHDAEDESFFASPKLNLSWLILFYKNNRAEDGEYFKSFIYKLCGTKALSAQVEQGKSADEIRATWQPELEKYKELRKKYLLYP